MKKIYYIIFCSILLLFSLSYAFADDEIENETPSIAINTTTIYTNESIGICLKNSNDTPLTNQTLMANLDNKNYSLITDLEGKTNLKLNLKANTYLLNIFYNLSENSTFNQSFNIKVLKQNTTILPGNTTVISGNYFYIYLINQNKESLTCESVSFAVNGKIYKSTTDVNGRASFKINLQHSTYTIKISYSGSDYYNSISKSLNLIVPSTTSIVIGNDKLLTNGYLRIYLKSQTQSVISKKTLTITINGKTFTKTTNSEGIIVFNPKMGMGTFKITVQFKGTSNIIGSSAVKTIKCIKGNVVDPFKNKIHLKNNQPDIDLMPSNYVLADGDMTYILTKVQYREVIKRDSYTLYLHKKLSKYTVFKSKSEPKLNHVIKREKWNVIERTINTKIVKKNKFNYWPKQITVSLKGKSYTYSEVRDKQNTPYTCAPTSGSMCSQVLRNYVCEKQLAKQAGTISGFGTKCQWIKKALEKNHFKCKYFVKKTFSKALKQLKKGGCALIFHTNNHYVAIIDISKNGKKVLVSNSYGRYDAKGAKLPNKWLTAKYVKTRFCSYDQRSLIVKLNYNLNKVTKKKINNFYSSMGTKWTRHNTSERLLDVGL